MSKRKLGQYYTTKNPFNGGAFNLWNDMRPKSVQILEPFAGSGNLFEFVKGEWVGFDIQPNHPKVLKRDTVKDFPKGFTVAITNPPYLAKNSAKRRGLHVEIKWSDLYLDCLELMLENCDWVAAIIPSTFWTQKKFKNRLIAWDKIDYELFSDTDNPVGVAYFGPEECKPLLFVNGVKIEQWKPESKEALEFNVNHGNYVLNGIDTIEKENIFIKPIDSTINESWRKKYVKHTSRHHCLFHSNKELDCEKVNQYISEWRKNTSDFYLTSFMSTMKSGKYRKRVGFKLLSQLISEGNK